MDGFAQAQKGKTMDDLISRQAAIESIEFGVETLKIVLDRTDVTYNEREKFSWGMGLLESYIEDIKELPSAHQRWIPCSERLPEANGRYFVTRGLSACGAMWNRVYIINYSDLMGLKSERIWWDGNVGKSDFERFDDVIAWMPLPEPYGGESDV